MHQANRLIVSTEFTTDSSARTLCFQRVLHTGGGRRVWGSRGNPNGVIYAVAVKTDVEVIVSILLQQISPACSLFLHWSDTIVCEVTGSRRVSADWPKKAWKPLYTAAFMGKLKDWSEITQSWSNNSTCTPQRLFSNLVMFVQISHFAMNIIMAQTLPNRQIQKFQQSAKISGHTVYVATHY